MSEEEIELVCRRSQCYGVVKEYTPDSERELPEPVKRIQEKRENPIIRTWYKIIPFIEPPDEPTWMECSICHTVHSIER